MTPSKRSSISARALAAFGVTCGFFTMLLSGVAIMLAPSGRFARSIDWHWIGLSRQTWEAVHLGAALGFAAAAFWHLALHLPIYRNLLGGTRAHPYGNRLDAIIVAALTILLVATAILDLPPSRWLVDLNQYFKQVYWARP